MNFVEFSSNYSPAVEKICEYLEVSDVKNLSLVYREWFSATNTSLTQRTCITVKNCYYWKFQRKYSSIAVFIGNFDINVYLEDFLKWFKSVNAHQEFLVDFLTFGTDASINVETLKLLTNLKSLKCLTLIAGFFEPLKEPIDISLNLIEFKLYSKNRSSDYQPYLSSICKSNNSLREIDSDIDEELLEIVVQHCPKIETLKNLLVDSKSIEILNRLGNLNNLHISLQPESDGKLISGFNCKTLTKLEIASNFEEADFNVFLENMPNLTDLKLTTNLKQWRVLALIAAKLENLKSLNLNCRPDEMVLEQHRPVFPYLEELKISFLTANDLLTRFSTPKIRKLSINGSISREEFLNFMNSDYANLEELSIQHLDIPSNHICMVLRHLVSLKLLHVYNCSFFSDKCIIAILDSEIQDAQFTVSNFERMFLWKLKVNKKWSIQETELSPSKYISKILKQFVMGICFFRLQRTYSNF